MSHQFVGDLIDGFIGQGIDVGEDGARGGREGSLVECLAKFFGGGGHERRMEGAGDIEGDGAGGAEGIGFFGGVLTGVEGSAEDYLARTVEVYGDEDFGVGQIGEDGVAEFPDGVGGEAEDGDHGTVGSVGGGLHGLAAELDEGEGVVEGHGFGGVEGSVFAEAESGAGVGGEHSRGRLCHIVQKAGAEGEQGSGAGSEDGGLGEFGGIEFFFRAIKAEVGEVVAYDVLGLLIKIGDLGVFVGEGFSHAYLLGALAGEHKQGFHGICSGFLVSGFWSLVSGFRLGNKDKKVINFIENKN